MATATMILSAICDVFPDNWREYWIGDRIGLLSLKAPRPKVKLTYSHPCVQACPCSRCDADRADYLGDLRESMLLYPTTPQPCLLPLSSGGAKVVDKHWVLLNSKHTSQNSLTLRSGLLSSSPPA